VIWAPAALAFAALATPGAAARADAQSVYLDKCVACHGKTGAPTPPFAKRGVKDLSDPEWQESRSDEQIRESIAKGAEDTLMRAFDRELDGDMIDALVGYVRTLRRP
jgi:mono/diheme cytochrome c family protein